MALNWAMLSEDGSRPVPLPGEKVFFSASNCSLSLDFSHQSKKWTANGSAFVTSQRILFLRQPPLPAPADPSAPSEHLRSLSVPLSQFMDTRYMIPIFSAPHYEASILPSLNGGLPARESGQASNTGLLKIWFNEGGGMAFRDAVEEVKSRREEGASNVEALPLYEAGSQVAASQPPASNNNASAASNGAAANAAIPTPTRSSTLPPSDDILAAQVAREQEEVERDAQREQSNASAPGPELPPAYQE